MSADIDARIDGPTLRAVLRERLRALAVEVDRTRQDRAFREALDAMRRFWRYSPFNQYLIRIQCPDATRVASRSTWASMGRRVKEGERAIGVLAPTRWKGGRGFVAVPVFDVSQTRGRRVPRLAITSRGRSRHVQTLQRAASRLGIALEYGGVPDGAAAVSLGGRILVRSELSDRDKVRAIAHELAHEVLHQAERAKALAMKRPPPRRTHAEEETEADATAYVVLGVLGVPCKVPAYVAWQGGTGAQVLRSMTRIQRAARAILEATEDQSASRRTIIPPQTGQRFVEAGA